MGIVNISTLGYQCDVCGFIWIPIENKIIPEDCPNCHSTDWYRTKGDKPTQTNSKLSLEFVESVMALDNDLPKEEVKKVAPNNKLNDLTGTDWVKFTKSWFILNPPPRKDTEILHPAKFPENLAKDFISFFTKKGDVVLDPFLGSGSTVVACNELERIGIGIELSPKYYKIASERCVEPQTKLTSNNVGPKLILGDAREAKTLLPKALDDIGADGINFVFTSPPYWNMLRESRGGVTSSSKKRGIEGLDTHYSEDEKDVGNTKDYLEFIESLASIFASIKPMLRSDAYIVVVVQNVRIESGEMKPLAWEVAKRLGEIFTLKQEKIWCQDNKPLGIWGYPSEYVSNVHHHYCLVFQNNKSLSDNTVNS